MSWRPFKDAKTRAEWRLLLLFWQCERCALCGHRFPREGELSERLAAEFAPTFDHVIPRSRGGRDERGNLQLVHYACNRARGDGKQSKPVPGVPRALHSSSARDA
jgi:5-methylcytosine-specific restriction endonuclease McrA